MFAGEGKRVWINAEARLVDTDVDITDKAMDICPVGAIIKKRTGYRDPIGKRQYDHEPIGSDIEKKKTAVSK